MNPLDIFALVVLIVLVVVALAVWAMLGMYPGKIAKQRNHPQAEAIAVCGWWGAITLGILTPLAYIWAYSKPWASPVSDEAEAAQGEPEDATSKGDES
jgi:Kef-type K+ transport system membrane component KefB